MRQSPECIDRAVQTISVSRYLERIADLSTIIAEDVVFTVDSDLIRHQVENWIASTSSNRSFLLW